MNNGKRIIEGKPGHKFQLFMEPIETPVKFYCHNPNSTSSVVWYARKMTVHCAPTSPPHPTPLNATNPCIWSIRSCYGGGDDWCVNNNNINYYGLNSIKDTIQLFLIYFVFVILNFVKVVVRVLIIFAFHIVLSFG